MSGKEGKPALVVLAAGMGSRYGGLKQMDPVGPDGEYILDYSVRDAMDAGFDKVVFVIRAEMEEDFERLIAARWRAEIPVETVYQEIDIAEEVTDKREKPWGTGHALLACAPVVTEPFAVVNADDYYGAGTYRALAGFLNGLTETLPLRCALVGFRLADTLSRHGRVSRGICRTDAGGMLLGIDECTAIEQHGGHPVCAGRELSGDECVSMNAWGFPAGFMPLLQLEWEKFVRRYGSDLSAEFYLPGAVDALMRRGRLTVEVLTGGGMWLGVTHRADREEMVRRLREAEA